MHPKKEQLLSIKKMLEKIFAHNDLLTSNIRDENEARDIEEAEMLLLMVNNALQVYQPEKTDEKLSDDVGQYLKKRFARIRNTSLCYTTNQQYIFNVICIQLANYCDANKRNSLLMPSVKSSDFNFTQLDELQLGEFILDDKGEYFLLIDDLVDEACSRIIKSERPLYVNKNRELDNCYLSENEISRLGTITHVINAIAVWYQNHTNDLLGELTTLRDHLLRGQVDQNDGEEMNAGRSANEGIAAFYTVYSVLSDVERNRLHAFTDGERNLGDLFGILFRDPNVNYRSVATCIKLLGQRLERILSHGDNAAALSGMSVDTAHRLNNLTRLVKSQLANNELSVNRDPLTHASLLNPDLSFDDTEWIVSLIAPRTDSMIPMSSKIIVEGLVDGQLFIGSYYPVAATGTPWPIVPEVLQNTGGVFRKIKTHESKGYTQLPAQDENGNVQIDESGKFTFKYDQILELRKSLSRSHRASKDSVKAMIEAIKTEAVATEFASWITPSLAGHQAALNVDAVLSNARRFTLFTPYERFGNKSLLGTGKHNCVTWCEEKLSIAGCSRSSILDYGKGKPVIHTIQRII